MDEVAARIEALEMRCAHQERAIDDLNAALIAQGEALDRLRRQIARLQDRLTEAEARAPAAPDPRPPHY